MPVDIFQSTQHHTTEDIYSQPSRPVDEINIQWMQTCERISLEDPAEVYLQ